MAAHEAHAPRQLGWGLVTVSSSRAAAAGPLPAGRSGPAGPPAPAAVAAAAEPAAASPPAGAGDASGDRVAALLGEAGQRLLDRRLVADDAAAIASAVAALLAEDGVDVVVTTGGTGISPSDVTPEAVAPLLERTLDGFGELFRSLSFAAVGPAALLSRALAGVAGRKAVFVLPGSPAAVELAMRQLVLPVAAHLVGQLRRVR